MNLFRHLFLKNGILSFFIIFFSFNIITGCKRTPSTPKEPNNTLQADTPSTNYQFGKSVKKQIIRGAVIGNGPDVTMLIGSIHGDESTGSDLIMRLENLLKGNPELVKGRKVVLLPNVNPDGVDLGKQNNIRNVDINHDFFSKKPQPETLAIISAIKIYKPSRIVSLRQLNSIDYDGPGATSIAYYIKRQCSLPIRKWGTKPGSFGQYGINHNIPIITFGLPKKKINKGELWRQYGGALLAAVTYSDKKNDMWKKYWQNGWTHLIHKNFYKAKEQFERCRTHSDECKRGYAEASSALTPQNIKPPPLDGAKRDPYYLTEGKNFYNNKRYEEAVSSLKKCKDYNEECNRWYERSRQQLNTNGEKQRDQYLSEGKRLYNKGRYKEAVRSFKKCRNYSRECNKWLVRSQEKLIEPIITKGIELYNQEKLEAAKNEFNKCRGYKKCKKWISKIDKKQKELSDRGGDGSLSGETADNHSLNVNDRDGDGTPDHLDECPDNPDKIAPGECGCEEDDLDSDNDNTPNCIDDCPDDPNKTAPGQCGCNKDDTDRDADSIPDCIDNCPDDPEKTAPGNCGCGNSETSCLKDEVGDAYRTAMNHLKSGRANSARTSFLSVYNQNPNYKDVKYQLYKLQLGVIENLRGKNAGMLKRYHCGSKCEKERQGFISRHLVKAERLANDSKDLAGVKAECNIVLSVDPNNQRAKDILIAIE